MGVVHPTSTNVAQESLHWDFFCYKSLLTGPFTVFAPTNAAFSTLPSDVIQKLKSDKQLLTNVLLSHVVNKTTSSKSLKDDQALHSMNDNVLIRINKYLPRYVRVSMSNL